METCHYPGYVIRLQAKRKKLHKEMCKINFHENDVPANKELSASLKSLKNLGRFVQITRGPHIIVIL